ncbi:hypothetical protein ABPG72_011646 [Tetrahymena utriculariae]
MIKINEIVDKLMQNLVKLISPDSMAFNEENFKQYTMKEFIQSEELKKEIQPGDIVLTKTSSNVYGIVRKMMDSEYDHVSVFLDQQNVLHISPPKVRIIPSNIFLMRRMGPFIIRPNLDTQERNYFIDRLKTFENQSYDYKGLIRIFGLKTIQHLFNMSSSSSYLLYNLDKAKTMKRKICTDLIIFTLAQSSKKFMEALKKNIYNLNFAFVGAFSPDDFKYLTVKERNLFQIIYPTEKDLAILQEEQRKVKVEKVNQSYQDYKEEVKIESQDLIPAYPKALKKIKNGKHESLIKVVARLIAVAQVNRIFQQGYLQNLKNKLDRFQFIQSAKLVYYLWSLKNFIFKKSEIMQNKVKFIQTVFQVFRLLSNTDIIKINFEKVFIPIIEQMLKKLYNYFFQNRPHL